MTLVELSDFLVKGFGKKPATAPKPAAHGGSARRFNEADHPRAADGQFSSGGGSNGAGANPTHATTLQGPNALYMSVGRGANGDTRNAKKASQKADDTDSKADHKAAAAAHATAMASHKKASLLASQSKLPEAMKIHISMEKYHQDFVKYHTGRS